jgi:hypothetical protein
MWKQIGKYSMLCFVLMPPFMFFVILVFAELGKHKHVTLIDMGIVFSLFAETIFCILIISNSERDGRNKYFYWLGIFCFGLTGRAMFFWASRPSYGELIPFVIVIAACDLILLFRFLEIYHPKGTKLPDDERQSVS